MPDMWRSAGEPHNFVQLNGFLRVVEGLGILPYFGEAIGKENGDGHAVIHGYVGS